MNNFEIYPIQYFDPTPDPTTGYRRLFVHKSLRWDMETSFIQVKHQFVAESEYEGNVIPAHHIPVSSKKFNSIYVEFRVFYFYPDTNNPNGFGELVSAASIAQGKVFPFRVTDSVWVDSQTGVVVNDIPLSNENDELIENPYLGLIGEYERFLLAANSGVQLKDLILQGLINAINNGKFD